MSNPHEVVQGLQQASQKHEKEIVIELGSDRILHYIGVYLVILLAALSKLSEVVGDKLSCYPATSNVTVDISFISYAKSYCWESSSVSSSDEINFPVFTSRKNCSIQHDVDGEENLLKNPSYFKTFLQWMPYGMLFEALLFALPSVWWHFRVGARLMGHLKFMKLLLDDIFNEVKPIPRGIYRGGTAYDKESYFLDGWVKYRPGYKRDEQKTKQPTETETRGTKSKDDSSKTQNENSVAEEPKVKSEMKEEQKKDSSVLEESEKTTNNNCCVVNMEKDSEVPKCQSIISKFLFGEMLDRHLFSMLCFENFSSLEQHPYILSVYKLTMTTSENLNDGLIDSKTKCILRLVCNNKNFNGTFLVRSYFLKYAFGLLVSCVALAITCWLLIILGSDGWTSESFRCDVIYHEDKCMVCTINRKTDLIAYLVANIVVNIVYLVISFSQWIFIKRSRDRASSYYFEEMCDTGSVALNKPKRKTDK